MLTEIEIEGFKSFGSAPLKVPLSALNFVVGANASGKTNFITALHFLQNALRQDVEFAVMDLGGATEVRNKRERQRRVEKPLRIRVHLNTQASFQREGPADEVAITEFDYTLVVDLRKEPSPHIVEERLRACLHHKDIGSDYELVRDEKQVRITDPFPLPGKGEQTFEIPTQEFARPAVNVGFFSVPALIFKSTVQSWSFYNISPQVARQPFKEVPDATLGTHGENLAVVLHALEKGGKANGKDAIVAALRGAVPGLTNLDTVRDGLEGKWALRVQEEGIRGPIHPASISDGTIRLIALLVVATLGAKKGGLVAIEEPENGLHPHLSEHLVRIFRDKSQHLQLIVSTHNPAFLDHLAPEEVLLCGKIDGFTRIRRVSELAEIKKFQKHFTLGELWVQGTFDRLIEGKP